MRALWTGSIAFGLVNIPVKLYRASRTSAGRTVSFHQLHKACGTRLQHVRRCPHCQLDVPWQEVVKGYEYQKGRYAVLSEEELDELLPHEEWATISIEHFVALTEVDPVYFDRAYYIAPEHSPRAYVLLHKALSETGKVAVSRVLLRTRSHLALVRPHGRHLVLETLFYAREMVNPAEVPGLPEGKAAEVDRRQKEAAEQLIGSMTVPWEPEIYKDEYSERVHQVIEEKIAGGSVTEPVVAVASEGGQVIDLLEALRRSVAATHGKEKESEPAARRGTSRTTRKAGRRRS